ncbi:MAG TPA: hypothetical protein VFQ61_22370, partial [Polyangiaceae bacterium]|nr:hypothetical protein [Polyangiaceae bacterium]
MEVSASSAAPAQALRVAFVVQRYGLEVNGGAELHCRELAERLARRPDVAEVRVLTTCAKRHVDWRNDYSPGTERLGGVVVERFVTDRPRAKLLSESLQWLLAHLPHPRGLEQSWL